MNDNRFEQHVNATATCVDLALSSVEGDLRKELEASTGEAAEALRRVLVKLKARRCDVIGLVSPGRWLA